MTHRTRRVVVARDIKFDEASLGSHEVKNDFTPLSWSTTIKKT